MDSEVTLKDWERRKDFVGFTKNDGKLLKELRSTAENFVDKIIDQLYEQFMKFDETKEFFPDEEILNHVKSMQKEYFIRLTEGDYGEKYLVNRLYIGRVHERIGLSPRWYIGAYSIYMKLAMPYIMKAFKNNAKKSQQAFGALLKLIMLDQDLAISTYIAAREEVISHQAKEILESGTPIIQIWDGVLVAPLIGTLDSQRTQIFMEKLLQRIVETGSSVALVDITGVTTIDSMTAQHLIETITAVKMLGAEVVLTGVRPETAQTLVHIGVDMSGIQTRSTLSAGLQVALKTLKYRVSKGRNLNDGDDNG